MEWYNPGCIHNYDPVISLISAEPNPVSKGGTVNLICKASDDDDSNRLKDDNLSYSWVAAVGEIVSEDLDNTAVVDRSATDRKVFNIM